MSAKTNQEYIEAIEYNTRGLTAVSAGVCPDCEGDGQRDETPDEFNERYGSGDVIAEPFFSWHGCDICGSTLGGDFEPWHAIDENGEIVHGDRACAACACYLANGDLPDR